MAKFRVLLTAAVGGLAFTATGHAADPPQWAPPELIRTVAPATAQLGGWYLRADVGYRWNSLSDAVTRAGFPVPTNNQVDNSVAAGLGAGFKWGHMRADLTGDYGFTTNYVGTGGRAFATARIQTMTALGNGYYDIGTWWGITPYIGAGAGVAEVRTSDYHSVTTPPLSPVGSLARFNFAWAAMAGASYQLLPNVSVDAGYRFLNQGDAKIAANASGSLRLDKLLSHEVRLGLRWSYDAPWVYGR